MDDDRFIVITSINRPTDAVARLSDLDGWRVVVVGDEKTPRGEDWGRATFLSLEHQRELGFRCVDHLRTGHYARKNIGYLYAMRAGAQLIFDTDDDNLPLSDQLPVPELTLTTHTAASDQRFVNMYRLYTDQLIWPRGLPLTAIRAPVRTGPPEQVSAPLQQALANHDPDVDAIYRLVISSFLDFSGTGTYALASGHYCPVNSQATYWRRDGYCTMLLPNSVGMRVTDIWRGYIAQTLLRRLGHSLVFTGPVLRQERNAHDILADFADELPVYRDVPKLIHVLENVTYGSIASMLESAYRAMADAGLVGEADVALSRAWCEDLRALGLPIDESAPLSDRELRTLAD